MLNQTVVKKYWTKDQDIDSNSACGELGLRIQNLRLGYRIFSNAMQAPARLAPVARGAKQDVEENGARKSAYRQRVRRR